MAAIFQQVLDWLKSLINVLLSILPDSPFSFEGAGEFAEVMGYINYFIPISTFLRILTAWLSAITIYYLALVVLRWVKAIE